MVDKSQVNEAATMLGEKLFILCDVLLLVNAINDTNLYDDINISDKNIIEYPNSYENNQISENPIFDKETEKETFNGDLDYAGPVDTGRRKGNIKYSKDYKNF